MVTLYGGVSAFGDDEYNDILNSDLSKEEKRKRIQAIGQRRDDEIQRNMYKDLAKMWAGGALEIGSAAIPMGLGARFTGGLAKGLMPYVGKKIAQEVGTGLVGGGLSGGVFGLGRGLMEDKNPLLTAGQDALLGTAMGGAVGYGAGQIGKKIAFNNLLKNETDELASFLKPKPNNAKFANYYEDYVKGVNNTNDFTRLSKAVRATGSDYLAPGSTREILYDQDSFHGTPFSGDIRKFDLDFMNTGEGAQMYGAGIYSAKDKDIANKHYRFIGEDVEPIKYNGEPLMSLYDKLERQAIKLHPRDAQPIYDKMSLLEDLDYKGGIDNLDYFSPETQTWYKNEIEPNLTMPGRLYRVQVPDNDVLLHSELPLNEQPEKVQKALRDMFFDQGIDIDNPKNLTIDQIPYSQVSGQRLYDAMNGLIDGNTTNRKATSQLFDEYGIKGIRAFGDRDGEIFVTFNPDNAKIVESYYPNKLYNQLINTRKPLKNPKLSDKINYIEDMTDVEKAKITSEFNTNLSNKQRKSKNIRKAVGNYYYTARNNGFNNYEFTGRYLIDDLYR